MKYNVLISSFENGEKPQREIDAYYALDIPYVHKMVSVEAASAQQALWRVAGSSDLEETIQCILCEEE